MSNVIEIPKLETGVVRVFSVSLPHSEAMTFALDPHAQAHALGVPEIDPEYARVFPVEDLQSVGLTGYLTEGLGISPETIGADKARLDAIEGHVAVITSKAFGQDGATLRVVPPLKLIGTYAEKHDPVSFSDLRSEGAHGTLSGPAAPPPPPVRGGHAGRIIALVVLAAAFIAIAVLGGRP